MTLEEYFTAHPRAAVAFSGGADSAYLLWAAKCSGCQVAAYYAKTAFQPAFELRDAQRLAGELGIPLKVVELDVLRCPGAVENGSQRCYHCKRAIFTALWDAARADGYSLLLDGTNASDDVSQRPGFRALRELDVASPLRLCGITKAELRERSRKAGLFTHAKPAYACLATRIPTGTPIRADDLRRVEQAEEALFHLGFSDLRVRLLGNTACIQLPEEQLLPAVQARSAILEALSGLFERTVLDLTPRKGE